jgi:3-oxoacyl-[acyl-carrier protein] reductase
MQQTQGSKRTALVTGAARGIGRAIALELGRSGHDVAVVDVDFNGFRDFGGDQETTVIAELEAEGARVLSAQASTTDGPAMEHLVGQIMEEWGGLNALVCNAGGGSGPLDGNRASAIDLEELDAVLHRNLHGTIATVKAALPALARADGPAVVTMGSVTGVQAGNEGAYAHYGITKAAVMHYTRYLARDLASRGVRANCVAPGPIATGRARQRIEEISKHDAQRAKELLANLGTPENVARAVRYLATPESGTMSGQILHLFR